MKKFMPLNEKNTKPNKPNSQLSKSFIKPSKSQIFLIKKHKKSTSPQRQKPELSKNDQRVIIYTDSTGFIVDYAILPYGVKCDCSITQTTTKKNNKTFKIQSPQPRQNFIKKKVKLQITLNKHNIAIIKNSVQHIFSLPQEPKHNFLKIVLAQNWQIEQFTIPNKKTKILDGEVLSASQCNIDQIYPLKNILEADELRKTKLVKSDSKIKISWGCSLKDTEEESFYDNKSEILHFSSQRLISDLSKSMILEPSKQIPREAFLRKSFNQCDQTRDSEEEQIIQEKHFQKKQNYQSPKVNKTLNIKLGQWNDHAEHKMSGLKTPRQTDMNHRIEGLKQVPSATCRFFK